MTESELRKLDRESNDIYEQNGDSIDMVKIVKRLEYLDGKLQNLSDEVVDRLDKLEEIAEYLEEKVKELDSMI